jgi:cytochrome c oxidase assembly factor CtaG
VRPWQAAAFLAGSLALVAALVSPVAALSRVLFSVHMTQHEVLMLVAAPLLVLGRPLSVWLWALPAGARARAGGWSRTPAWRRAWGFLTGPLIVWLLHGAILWIWHLPALYEAAVGNEAIHAFEHLCFLLTAGLFWWALIHGRYGRLGYGMGVLYVFLTALHTGALGALLTFAPRVLYPLYGRAAVALHRDPLEDQQLAGLLMWIPFGVVFLLIALALLAAWLGESERRGRLLARDARSGTLLLALLAAAAAVSAGCGRDRESAERWTSGNVDLGRRAILRYGCGSCHTIPGVPGAHARVGPSLDGIARQSYLAGNLQNEPRNMIAWVRHPQHLHPPNAMPDLGVSEADARDIAAYLYTLR